MAHQCMHNIPRAVLKKKKKVVVAWHLKYDVMAFLKRECVKCLHCDRTIKAAYDWLPDKAASKKLCFDYFSLQTQRQCLEKTGVFVSI